MLRVAEAFIFERKKSLIHELDPRVKFLATIIALVISILSNNMFIHLTIIILSVGVSIFGKELRKYINSILMITPFFLFIFIVNYIVNRELISSLVLSLRLVVMTSAFSLFFALTPPEDFILMLEAFKFPQTISFSFSLALRFIPVMAEEAQRIIDAQRSRGLELEFKNPFKRIRNLIPIFIPLIVLSIKRSIEIAEALEARGFNPSRKRTSIIKLKMGRTDYLALLLITSLTMGYACYTMLYGF